jgi:tRNA(Ile)-lysidine synthase
VIELPGGWQVQRRYDWLSVAKGTVPGVAAVPVAKGTVPGVVAVPEVPAFRIKVPGVTLVKALNLRITTTLSPGIVKDRAPGPGVYPARATVSAIALKERKLWLRPARAGDRIAPFGMTGSRKLQDILVDAKVPRADRAGIPVLVCEDRVVWLPGYRIDRSLAVVDPAAPNLQLSVTAV